MIGLKQKFESRIQEVRKQYEEQISELEKKLSDLEKRSTEKAKKAAKKFEDLLDRNIVLERELEELEEVINRETI